MSSKQLILNIPEWVYKELDKLSGHRVKTYLSDILQKMTIKPRKSDVRQIFDLFKSKKSFSMNHDSNLYK